MIIFFISHVIYFTTLIYLNMQPIDTTIIFLIIIYSAIIIMILYVIPKGYYEKQIFIKKIHNDTK